MPPTNYRPPASVPVKPLEIPDICGWCHQEIPLGQPANLQGGRVICTDCLQQTRARAEGERQADLMAGAFQRALVSMSPMCKVPEYAAAKTLIGLLFLLGGVDIAAGILGALAIFIRGANEGELAAASTLGAAVFFSGLISGLILMGISQLLECLRDMAINSFLLRNGK